MRCFTPSGSLPTSMPPTIAVPLVGLSRPHSIRMVVDLPAPLLPRNPKISPAWTSKLTRSTATNLPKRRVSSTTEIAIADGSAANGPIQSRLRGSQCGDSLCAIEPRAHDVDLRVEHVGARRDAGRKAFSDDAAGFGGGANGVVGGR